MIFMKRQVNEVDQGCKAAMGFTIVELTVVLAVVALMAATLLPVLAGSAPDTKSIRCRNNLKQLAAAWQMYAEDYSGTIVANFGGGYIPPPTSVAGWVTGWLDWSSSSDNTNLLYLTSTRYAAFGSYLNRATNVFKCPADTYISGVQRARGWTQRVRSYSLNVYVGDDGAIPGPRDPIYRQVKKLSEFRYPSIPEVLLFLDEHPDSINDPVFFAPHQTTLPDYPANYHQGGAVVAMGDGRAEIRKWRGSLTVGSATSVGYQAHNNLDAPADDPDVAWLSYHTPRVSSQSY